MYCLGYILSGQLNRYTQLKLTQSKMAVHNKNYNYNHNYTVRPELAQLKLFEETDCL